MQPKRWILFSLFILMAVSAVEAQDSFKCESNDGGRKHCGSFNSNQITLDRQISGSACIEGQTWGVDREGLWVDRGCRAYFRVNRYQGGDQGGYQGNQPSNDREGWWGRQRDEVRRDVSATLGERAVFPHTVSGMPRVCG